MIPDSVSNNSNDLNSTNITVNTDDVSHITIIDSPHEDFLSISEELRNIRAEYYSKCLESKRSKDINARKPLYTTSYVTPVTEKDNMPSNDTRNKLPKGTICIARDSILNGIDESLLSQKRSANVRQFMGVTITDIYDHLKPILKQKPEFLILHIGKNDTSEYTPNEIVDKVLAFDKMLALKRFVAN